MQARGLDRETESLVFELARKLESAGIMCATAESCTGGWIAQTMTSLAGSSNWFDCAFVTYSNASKQRLLGVDGRTIESHGAVSDAVARAMVVGAVANSGASAAVSVTGIAGPDGGTARKPVGTVVFAWLTPSMREPAVETVCFPGDRTAVRWAAVVHAVAGLNRRL